jgi:DNA-binding MarR family transcriptional regulator
MADPLDTALLRQTLLHLARRIRKRADVGLGSAALSALSTIARHPGLTLTRLGELEQLARPSVTRLVADLEGMGLILRTASASDRRAGLLTPTDSGLVRLTAANMAMDTYLEAQFDRLSPGERSLLAATQPVLKRLLEPRR